jgi:outer membrane cobalamin receptor
MVMKNILMKKIIFIIICHFNGFILPVQAQVLTGKVTDAANGNPLPDVAVGVLPGKTGTHTDAYGYYTVHLGPGKYTVEVQHIGYMTELKEVVIPEKDTVKLHIQLRAKIFEQEQIVVTASKTERDRASVPLNITVMTPEIIRESSETNILPMLNAQVPGLFITERGVTGFGLAGGSAGKISIRGVGGTDASFPVLLLIDGQPQFMGLMGHSLPDTYVSANVDKVEVIKGPASVLYGSNAMGGAINLITRKQKEDGFSLNGKIKGGSYNTLMVHTSAGFRKKRFGVLASFQHDQTDGHRPSSDFKLNSGSMRMSYAISRHISADATINRSSFKAYDPGSIYGSPADYANNSHWVDIVRTNGYFSVSNQSKISEGGIKAYILWGDHDLYDGWKSHDENKGLSVYQGFRFFRGSLISIGFDMKKYGGKGISPALGNKSGQYLSVQEKGAYFMADQTFFNNLTLNAGFRWDHHSGFGATWIPQMGATYKATNHSNAKFLISRGFRNPSIRELYFFPTANPDLRPESMWNYELTWMQRFADRKGMAEITGYMIKGDNLIQLVPNQPAPPPMKNANTGTFDHKGVEITVKYSPITKLTFQGSYSYLHMDRPKISSPVHQLFMGGIFKMEQLSVSVNVQHIAKLYTWIGPKDYSTENYTLLNSKIGYHFNSHIELFLSGENLLDQDYQMQYGYPMPGVMLFGGVNISM